MTKKTRAVGLGAMNLDELYRVPSVLADDETTVETYQVAPGGSAANTIYGLAKLGIDTAFIGAVGDDEAGEILIRDLKNAGVDVSQVKIIPAAKTGKVLGLTDRQGKRALYVVPGANGLLTKKDIDLDYIKQADVIHLSSFVGKQQFELQKWLLKNISHPTKVSFAPGAIYVRRGLDALTPLLVKTDILFVNQTEIEELTGSKFRAATRFLLEQGCEVIVVTLGKGVVQRLNKGQLKLEFSTHSNRFFVQDSSSHTGAGSRTESFSLASYVADASKDYLIESERGDVVDPTGAGDAFAAGFLYGFLQGRGLEECGYLGDIVASFSLTKIGARAGLPTVSELTQKYEQRCALLSSV
jgi:ribokinase